MREFTICFILSFVLKLEVLSQASIGPVIGWEFSSIINYTDNFYLQILDDNFKMQNPLVGVRIDYKLSDFNYLSIIANDSQKMANVTNGNSVPATKMKIDCYKLSVSFRKNINKLILSGGLYADLITNGRLSYEHLNGNYQPSFSGFQEYGLLSTIGFGHREFLFELFCYYGLTKNTDPYDAVEYQQFISIGAHVSYSFLLQFQGGGKKVNCPKF
jgi:hypothetical protein